MKGAFSYLLVMRAKNSVKSLARSPAKLIYAIFMIGLLSLMVFTSGSGRKEAGFTLRTTEELCALVTGFYLIMFALIANNGFMSGASVFKMPDVNFIFTGPVSPAKVLFYGLFQQLGTSLLMAFFILFQYSWLHNAYNIGVGGLLLVLLGYAATVFTAQLCAMGIYIFTSSRQRIKMIARLGFYGLFLILCLWAIAAVSRAEDLLPALSEAGNSLPVRLFPVGGWIGGAVSGLLTGNIPALVTGLSAWLVFFAAAVAALALAKPDYYEDVLQNTEMMFLSRQDAKEGRISERLRAKVRLGKTGFGSGWGAGAFYHKHRLENRRSRFFLLDGPTLVFALIIVAFSFIIRSAGLIPVLAFGAYMQVFSVSLGRFVRELTKPYIYLAPEQPFHKLLWCLAESVPGFFLEAALIFVPVCLILGLGVPEMLACVLARVAFSLLFIAGNLVVGRVFGSVTLKALIVTFYILTLLLVAAPGIAAAAVYMSGVRLYSLEVTVCLMLFAVNTPAALLCMYLCKGILERAELHN